MIALVIISLRKSWLRHAILRAAAQAPWANGENRAAPSRAKARFAKYAWPPEQYAVRRISGTQYLIRRGRAFRRLRQQM